MRREVLRVYMYRREGSRVYMYMYEEGGDVGVHA